MSRALVTGSAGRPGRSVAAAPAAAGHEVIGVDPAPGTPREAAEDRAVTARPLPEADAWALELAFTLHNRTDGPPTIRSPARKGRVGAGYGGSFWRAPEDSAEPEVCTAEARGEPAVHGGRTPWPVLTGRGWSLVFVQVRGLDPWFVRVAEHPGVGPAPARDTPLRVPDRLDRAITVVVADGRLTAERADALAELVVNRPGGDP